MADDTPYVHPPDEQDDDPEKNGLICFMDMNRPCAADCMAYLTHPDPMPGLGPQQSHCALLLSAHRLTQRVGVLAKHVSDTVKDNRRAASPAPPNPMTGSR